MRTLLLAALVSAGNAAAAPFAVHVGEAKIGLDAPPGFADTTATGSPRLLELGEALTDASNRILLFAISDADMRRFTVGDPLELRRYMVVATSRVGERHQMSETAFQQVMDQTARVAPKPPATEDYRKYLDSQPTGNVYSLADLRKDAETFSALQGIRTKGGGWFERSKYLLSTKTAMLVRGKVLELGVYTQYDDAGDLEWIRVTTTRWIDELKRLNSR